MPTEWSRQVNRLWIIGGVAALLVLAWRPAASPGVLAGIALGALSSALARDYWSAALPVWHWSSRHLITFASALIGAGATLLWAVAPLIPIATILLLALVLHWQRGRWPHLIDRLTGLPTAAAFTTRGEEELSRGLRFGRPAVVAVIAIDNANEILAKHGREALDSALRRVTDILRQHSRSYDLLGRLDNARFALFLPETNQDDAATVVERIRAAIGRIQSIGSDGRSSINLVAKIGLATHPWGGNSVRTLVGAAEAKVARGATDQDPAARTNGRTPEVQEAPSLPLKAPIAVRRFRAPAWSIWAFIAVVWTVTGLLFTVTFSFEPIPDWPSYFTLLLIGAIARQSQIVLYGRGAISFFFVPLIAASVLFGPTYALLLGAGTMVLMPWGKTFRWQSFIFNVASTALIPGTLALIASPLAHLLPSQLAPIPQGLLLGGLCYILNASLLIIVMSLHEGANPLAIWRERMSWFLPYTLAFGVLGVFMAWAGQSFGPPGIIAFGIPTFMTHLVTKQYVDRTKDHVAALREAHDHLAGLNRDLQASVDAVERSYSATLSAFSGMLDARDSETEGHSQRVVAYAVAIGRELGLGAHELATLEVGALLHDIGKVGIPDAILRKPGKLDPQEWAEMRRHPEIGHQLTSRIPFLNAASPLVRHHHERWDGRGYPDGLRGEDIPLAARIFAVADTYDALVSDRPYRLGCSHETAIEEIQRSSGTQFDPEIVATFMQVAASRDWAEQAIKYSTGTTIPVSQLALH